MKISENKNVEGMEELKKSLGLLNLSTGIFYLATSIIYWIFFASLFIFLIGLLDDIYFFLVYILNGILVYCTLIGALNFFFGVIILKNKDLTDKLKKGLKLINQLSIALFPIGTISGIITLKNYKEIIR